MSEFKEFWIYEGTATDSYGNKNGFASVDYTAPKYDSTTHTHVIEYKAFEELRKETDKLATVLYSAQMGMSIAYEDFGDKYYENVHNDIKSALAEFHEKYTKGD